MRAMKLFVNVMSSHTLTKPGFILPCSRLAVVRATVEFSTSSASSAPRLIVINTEVRNKEAGQDVKSRQSHGRHLK